MIRFVDATGLLGNALVIAAIASRALRWARLGLGGRSAVLAGVLAAALVPLGGLPLAAYLRGVIGDPSITTLLLLFIYLAGYVRAGALPPQVFAGRQALLALVAASAVVLYPLALGWGSFDPYRLGYGSYGLLAALLAVAAAAMLRSAPLVAAALALAVLAWSAGWYASPNLWDYLLDPLAAVYAAGALSAQALRRLRGPGQAGLK